MTETQRRLIALAIKNLDDAVVSLRGKSSSATDQWNHGAAEYFSIMADNVNRQAGTLRDVLMVKGESLETRKDVGGSQES